MKRRLNIVVVTIADLPDGWGRTSRLKTLAGALTGLGHEVVIWNQHGLESAGGQCVSGEVRGARFEYVLGKTERGYGFGSASDKLRAVWLICRKLVRAHRERRVDAVIFNHLAFYDTFPITLVARRRGIATIQCYEDERMELVLKDRVGMAQRVFGLNSWMADQWCSRMADAIWVISTYLQEKYSRLSRHPERVHIIPTIIDCEAWAMPEETPSACPTILYSGGFGEHEEVEKLVDALALLRQRGVAFRMVFLGANPKLPRVGTVRAQVERLGLSDLVELRGFSPSDVVKKEMAGAHVLINLRTNSLWSRSGLSTKLSEYLASGRCVLTTSIGDNAKYVRDGESALVVSPDAGAAEIAQILGRALVHPELRKQLGAGAREAARTHFDTGVIQKKLQSILDQVVSSTHGSLRE